MEGQLKRNYAHPQRTYDSPGENRTPVGQLRPSVQVLSRGNKVACSKLQRTILPWANVPAFAQERRGREVFRKRHSGERQTKRFRDT